MQQVTDPSIDDAIDRLWDIWRYYFTRSEKWSSISSSTS